MTVLHSVPATVQSKKFSNGSNTGLDLLKLALGVTVIVPSLDAEDRVTQISNSDLSYLVSPIDTQEHVASE